MDDLDRLIEQLELAAIDHALIADLATDWDVRIHDAAMARQLRSAAGRLRAERGCSTKG